MTEEIEAHVLKKYEILQKLGKCITKKSATRQKTVTHNTIKCR